MEKCAECAKEGWIFARLCLDVAFDYVKGGCEGMSSAAGQASAEKTDEIVGRGVKC